MGLYTSHSTVARPFHTSWLSMQERLAVNISQPPSSSSRWMFQSCNASLVEADGCGLAFVASKCVCVKDIFSDARDASIYVDGDHQNQGSLLQQSSEHHIRRAMNLGLIWVQRDGAARYP